MGGFWGIAGPEMHPPKTSPTIMGSHMHVNPQELQCYSPSGDSWTQETPSARGLKLERSWFTIAASQIKSQMNLSNNLKLGNVVPLL